MEELTIHEKLLAVQKSDTIINAVQLLIAAFNDTELKSHIRFVYTIEGKKYEITFLPISFENTYNQK